MFIFIFIHIHLLWTTASYWVQGVNKINDQLKCIFLTGAATNTCIVSIYHNDELLSTHAGSDVYSLPTTPGKYDLKIYDNNMQRNESEPALVTSWLIGKSMHTRHKKDYYMTSELGIYLVFSCNRILDQARYIQVHVCYNYALYKSLSLCFLQIYSSRAWRGSWSRYR